MLCAYIYMHSMYMVNMYIDLCVFMCMNIVCMFSYLHMFVYMYV